MECAETKDLGLDEPKEAELSPSAKPRGRFVQRGVFRRGFTASVIVHAALISVFYTLIDLWVVEPIWEPLNELQVSLLEPADRLEFPAEPVEPEKRLEEPEPEEIPELVEQPEPLPEMPEDPPPPEPLDWNAPEDLLLNADPWLPAPTPEAVPQPIEIEVEPQPELPPPPVEPRILEGDAIPAVIESSQPSYPRRALRMRWEGTVCLLITVDPEGFVTSCRIEESSGHGVLDEAAKKAFESWVFREVLPGEPSVRRVRKRFTFQLP